MSKPFNKMTKAELEKAAAALKLIDAVKENAKDAEAPTNAEYVTVLEEYKAKQDEVNADTKAEIEAETKVEKTEPSKGQIATAADKAAFNDVMFMYQVTDHDNTQIIDDDSEGRVFPLSWSNSRTGPRSFNVNLDGKPQGLPIGVVKKLQTIYGNKQTRDGEGNPKVEKIKRFSVSKLDESEQLDEAKLEDLKANQAARR